MPEFHWYEGWYLAAVDGIENRGYIKPWVYLAEIYWPGHGLKSGDGYHPSIDLHIAAQHWRHIWDRWPPGGGPAVLTTIECDWDFKHKMGLHPYRYSIPLIPGPYMPGDPGSRRMIAYDTARYYSYSGPIAEYSGPEFMFQGPYGT